MFVDVAGRSTKACPAARPDGRRGRS